MLTLSVIGHSGLALWVRYTFSCLIPLRFILFYYFYFVVVAAWTRCHAKCNSIVLIICMYKPVYSAEWNLCLGVNLFLLWCFSMFHMTPCLPSQWMTLFSLCGISVLHLVPLSTSPRPLIPSSPCPLPLPQLPLDYLRGCGSLNEVFRWESAHQLTQSRLFSLSSRLNLKNRNFSFQSCSHLMFACDLASQHGGTKNEHGFVACAANVCVPANKFTPNAHVVIAHFEWLGEVEKGVFKSRLKHRLVKWSTNRDRWVNARVKFIEGETYRLKQHSRVFDRVTWSIADGSRAAIRAGTTYRDYTTIIKPETQTSFLM